MKKLNGEYKYVGIYFLYKDGDVKVFRSPKILIKKLQRYEKKTEDGNFKPLTYIIKDKDTLFDIAKKYHTTVALLCGLNKIKDANRIYKGQKIQVHPNYKASGGNASHNIINTNSLNNSEIYKVKLGDTLSGISVKTAIPVSELQRINNLFSINKIYVEPVNYFV